jgi:diaminopimelate epimerase
MGNITVLVTDFVPLEKRREIADMLMIEVSDAEQVGFVVSPRNADARLRLEMAGGEFCGNATLSLAAQTAMEDAARNAVTVALEVSGAEEIVRVKVEPLAGDQFRCTMNMPLPGTVGAFETMWNGAVVRLPMVRLPGIVHFVIEQNDDTSPDEAMRAYAELRIKSLAQEVPAEAYGLIFLKKQEEAGEPSPCFLLYVPDANTLIWENACGSGSAAAAAYLAVQRGGQTEATLKQPGGDAIKVAVQTTLSTPEESAVTELKLTGEVTYRRSIQ